MDAQKLRLLDWLEKQTKVQNMPMATSKLSKALEVEPPVLFE